jgi:hypothetical protein
VLILGSKTKFDFSSIGLNFPTLYLPSLLVELSVVSVVILFIIEFLESANFLAIVFSLIAAFVFMLIWAAINLLVPNIFGIKNGTIYLSKSDLGEVNFRVQTIDFPLFYNSWLMGNAVIVDIDADENGSYIKLETYYFVKIKLYVSKKAFEQQLAQL